MAQKDVLQVLVAAVAGAGLAAVADRALGQYGVTVPGTNVRVEPGAAIGGALVLGSAALGRRGSGEGKNLDLKSGAAAVGTGMVIWEGGKLLDQHVLPSVPGLSQFYGGPACPTGQTRDPVTGQCVQAPVAAPLYVGGRNGMPAIPQQAYPQAYSQPAYGQQQVAQAMAFWPG